MISHRLLKTSLLVLSIALATATVHAVENGTYGKVMVSWTESDGVKHNLYLELTYSSNYGWSSWAHHLTSKPALSGMTRAETQVNKDKWHILGLMYGIAATIEVFPATNSSPAYLTLQFNDGKTIQKLGPIIPSPDDIFWVDWASLP